MTISISSTAADIRASTPAERLALKAAVRRAVKLAGGGASVCHALRVGDHDLSRYGSPEHDLRHCPIDVALDLDREAGSPVIVSALAAAQGYRLVRGDGEAGRDLPGLADAAAITGEAAQVVQALAAGLADGRLDHAESEAVNREIEEACRVLRQLQAKLPGRAGR